MRLGRRGGERAKFNSHIVFFTWPSSLEGQGAKPYGACFRSCRALWNHVDCARAPNTRASLAYFTLPWGSHSAARIKWHSRLLCRRSEGEICSTYSSTDKDNSAIARRAVVRRSRALTVYGGGALGDVLQCCSMCVRGSTVVIGPAAWDLDIGGESLSGMPAGQGRIQSLSTVPLTAQGGSLVCALRVCGAGVAPWMAALIDDPLIVSRYIDQYVAKAGGSGRCSALH